MNPSSNTGMELPPPVGEQAISPPGPQEVQDKTLEQSPSPSYETLANPPGAGTGVPAPPPPPSVPLAAQQTQTATPVTDDYQSPVDVPAEDKDLIEKEWVNKAKAIVAKTRDDPYAQSEQLTLLKADYLQKRYNKTLKLSN